MQRRRRRRRRWYGVLQNMRAFINVLALARGKRRAALKYTPLKVHVLRAGIRTGNRVEDTMARYAIQTRRKSRGSGKSEGLDQPEPGIVGDRYQSFDGTRNRIGGRGGPFEAGQRRSELQRGLIDEGLNARETLMQYASRRVREGVIWRAFATHASLSFFLYFFLSLSLS